MKMHSANRSSDRRHRMLSQFVFAGIMASVTPAALGAWPAYGISRIGFYGPINTAANGSQSTTIVSVGTIGGVIGYSQEYAGATNTGQAAWFWSPSGDTQRIGLTGTGYLDRNGRRSSTPKFVASNGSAAGISTRYEGLFQRGTSAWAWSPGVGSVNVGLIDPTHTSAAGVQNSNVLIANGIGGFAGSSQRYINGIDSGFSAWVWTPGGPTVRVGLTDADHTWDGRRVTSFLPGTQNSSVVAMSRAGQVIGKSTNFVGNSNFGESAWTYTPSTGSQRIGLIGGEYVDAAGLASAQPLVVSEGGAVAGVSSRYTATNNAENADAWVWRPTVGSIWLGIVDALHTRNDGVRNSAPYAITSNGTVVGSSYRFYGGQSRTGTDYWVARPDGTTIPIDLSPVTPNSGPGGTTPFINGVTDSVNVVGTVDSTAWFWSESTGARRLGLIDNDHTIIVSGTERQDSRIVRITPTNLVLGSSTRYTAAARPGDAWIYDAATGITTAIIIPTETGFAASVGNSAITDAGDVFGEFTLYNGTAAIGQYGYAWSPTSGYIGFGELVDGGLSTAGWTSLQRVVGVADSSVIAGYGTLFSSSGQGAYALFAVPEPSASLAMVALRPLLTRRIRRV